MGKAFNQWLRAQANAGISVGDINQASGSFLASPQGKPTVKAAQKKKSKPKPKPKSSGKVTLKQLRNRKGKVVGMGHFKGNETQNVKAAPKKAPKSKAGKAALLDAISKTNNNIASRAKKTQAKVLPKPKLAVARAKNSGIKDAATLSNIAKAKNPLKAAKKGSQRKAVMTGAIASGVDPVAARGLGYVKNIGKAVKKSKAGIAVAQAGGDIQSQIDVMSGNKPIQKAKNSIPGITEAFEYGEDVKRINAANDNIKQGTEVVGGGQAYDDYNVKEKGKNFRRRRRSKRSANPQSAGLSSGLKVQLNSGQGGINP